MNPICTILLVEICPVTGRIPSGTFGLGISMVGGVIGVVEGGDVGVGGGVMFVSVDGGGVVVVVVGVLSTVTMICPFVP